MATEEDKTSQAERLPVSDDSSAIDAAAAGVSAKDATTDADAAVIQCANLFLNVRRLLFMSLGALALTAEEARDFIDRLGERGDIPQEEMARWLDELHQQHPSTLADAPRNGGDALWGRLRVPTRRELETLSRKINALDQKLAALRARRTLDSSPATVDPATPPEL